MSPVVFGSPEAQKIIKADIKKFGEASRNPDADGVFEKEHLFQIVVRCDATVLRTYHVFAYSQESALSNWREGEGEIFDEEVEDSFNWNDEEITDLGEVKK